MKKFNWKIVAPIAMLVIGLLGGSTRCLYPINSSRGYLLPIQQIQVLKQLRPYTTIQQIQLRPLRKYKNAVVSVINYQEGSSSDSLNELYGHIFGGDDSSDSSQDKSKDSDGLQVAGEGSGSSIKDGKEAYIVTNNHVVDGAKNLKSCFQMDQNYW